MLIFRTTDMTKWGAGKGSNLTPDEVDENFWDLDERVRNLEENPPLAIGITSITATASQMTVHLSDGSNYTIRMPIATFHWRGDFTDDTEYAVLDEIRVGGVGRVLVLQAHTSVAPFDLERLIGGDPVYFLLEELGIIFGDAITQSRELEFTDANRYIDCVPGTSGDDILITVTPESSDTPWQIGTTIDFERQDEDGAVEIVWPTGVTVNCAALPRARAQWSVISLLYKGGDTWTLNGDLDIA